MKYIDKQQEPQSFLTWKGRNNADLRSRNTQNLSSEAKRLWKKLNGTPEKEAIKISLLKEQGYICCYCQKRIANDDSSQIEHLKSRENYPINTLDYDNFLATCDGGQIDNTNRDKSSSPSFPEYCGKNKGSNELNITPLQVNCDSYFQYQLDFVINPTATTISISPIGNDAANVLSILNLNIDKLKANRYQALLTLILKNPLDADLEPNYANLKSKTELEAELNSLFDQTSQTFRRHNNNNNFLPYCQISYQAIKELISVIYP